MRVKAFRSVRVSVCKQVWWGYPLQRGFLFGEDERGPWIYPNYVKPRDGYHIRVLRPFGLLSIWHNVDPKTNKPVEISVKSSQTARDLMVYFNTTRPFYKPTKGKVKAPNCLSLHTSNMGRMMYNCAEREPVVDDSTKIEWSAPAFASTSYDDARIDRSALDDLMGLLEC